LDSDDGLTQKPAFPDELRDLGIADNGQLWVRGENQTTQQVIDERRGKGNGIGDRTAKSVDTGKPSVRSPSLRSSFNRITEHDFRRRSLSPAKTISSTTNERSASPESSNSRSEKSAADGKDHVKSTDAVELLRNIVAGSSRRRSQICGGS